MHQVLGVLQCCCRGQRDGVGDHARLGTLHTPYFCGLVVDGEVAMNDAKTTYPSKCNGKSRLGDFVHRGRNQWHGKLNVASKSGAGVNGVWQDVAVSRDDNNIVEGESFEIGKEIGV